MKLFLNLDKWFTRRYCLKDFLSRALAALFSAKHNHLSQFGREHYGEHRCEIILNLDKPFRRRCCLKKKFTQDGRTSHYDDIQRPIRIAYLEPSAQLS